MLWYRFLAVEFMPVVDACKSPQFGKRRVYIEDSRRWFFVVASTMELLSADSCAATAVWYYVRTVELADTLIHTNLVFRVAGLFRIQCL